MDRRGESEESGDDETKRKSLNGEVDSLQAPSTGETTLAWRKQLKRLSLLFLSLPLRSLPFLVPEESPVDMDTITLDPDEEVKHSVFERVGRWMLLALWFIVSYLFRMWIWSTVALGRLRVWRFFGRHRWEYCVVFLGGGSSIVGLSSYWIK